MSCRIPLVREPLTAEDATPLARRLKALADPARLRLLSLVAAHEGGEACVCDLIEPIGLSQPTVSHHLKGRHAEGGCSVPPPQSPCGSLSPAAESSPTTSGSPPDAVSGGPSVGTSGSSCSLMRRTSSSRSRSAGSPQPGW